MDKNVSDLIEMSRKYGSDPRYVLAGGGNTSYKTEDILYVKASGFALATIVEEGFTKLYRAKLDKIFASEYSENEEEREAQVLAELMGARLPESAASRPSVETLMHNLMPQKFVLHLHPSIVNGMTCSANGEETAKKLFPDAIWVGNAKPGYILSKVIYDAMVAYKASRGRDCDTVFLENHGVIFAADTTEKLDAMVDSMMKTLADHTDSSVSAAPEAPEFDRERSALLAPAIRIINRNGGVSLVRCLYNGKIAGFIKDAASFSEINGGDLTPDHIVYIKSGFVFCPYCENIDDQYAAVEKEIKAYKAVKGYAPKIVAVEKTAVFVCGESLKELKSACELFGDAVDVVTYSRAFGGVKYMPEWFSEFIKNWEVESYRKKVSTGGSTKGRVDGNIMIITGGAQGFGRGIADEMVKEGALMLIADLNGEGAAAAAADMNSLFGVGKVISTKTNVTDEADMLFMAQEACLQFGGIDTFISNAGVARSGNLEEIDLSYFEFATRINYAAYFLGAKYCSRFMKIQHRFDPDWTMDIIQNNSKSGLEGSNKNFTYAGSKFGGIGLTESFALELVEYNIKVNSVCPGNFLDGPLWTDPVKGLFMLYFKSGKVPGAKNVEDVRKYYESKVPMKRGCFPVDVARAMLYCIEQKYETGQAIPVTGGQIMLK